VIDLAMPRARIHRLVVTSQDGQVGDPESTRDREQQAQDATCLVDHLPGRRRAILVLNRDCRSRDRSIIASRRHHEAVEAGGSPQTPAVAGKRRRQPTRHAAAGKGCTGDKPGGGWERA
jgi:hypothetical protein